jgi:hypothetical protein
LKKGILGMALRKIDSRPSTDTHFLIQKFLCQDLIVSIPAPQLFADMAGSRRDVA